MLLQTVLEYRTAQRGRLLIAVLFWTAILCTAPKAASGESDSCPASLKTWFVKNHYQRQHVGIVLKRIDTDAAIISVNADTLFNPASVAKLTTAAIAFDRLGSAYTYKTNVFCDGAYQPDSGICKGTLYVKGSGDPSIVIERMWLFVQYLYRFAGLRSINGDVVLDDSFFDTASIGPCFEDDSTASNPYAAPVNALSANFNTVELYERPGSLADDPIRVEIFPNLPTISIANRAKTTSARKTVLPSVQSEKSDDRTCFVISGAMNRDAEPNHVIRKVRQTWEHFGAIFKLFLDENKILLKGRVRRGTVPDSIRSGRPLSTWESPPLWQLVNDMMKFSTNFCAEMIFKTLSAARDSGNGTWEKSAQLAADWWKEKGLPGSPLVKNGSGMGDCNRYTPAQLAALLRYMWGEKQHMPELLAAFPAAGVDGTLRSRFKESRLKGLVRGKTGTLNDYGVYTMAGYVLMPKNTYIYVILFNGVSPKLPYKHWEAQQKLLEMIVPE